MIFKLYETYIKFIIIFILASIFVIRIGFIISDHRDNVARNRFVTTAGAKYCYIRGYENGSMKNRNKRYYSSAELCGKPLYK